MKFNDINLCPRNLRPIVFQVKTSASQDFFKSLSRPLYIFIDINNVELRGIEVNYVSDKMFYFLSSVNVCMAHSKRFF